MTGPSVEKDARREVIDILAHHDQRTQNMEGDWLCACGSFLCPPDDDRLDNCHREHLAAVLTRRVVPLTARVRPLFDEDRAAEFIAHKWPAAGVTSPGGGNPDDL